jgi:hypothetical protein
MSQEREALKRELPIITRMINGFLATNPELAGFFINGISIAQHLPENTDELEEKDLVHNRGKNKPPMKLMSCSICRDGSWVCEPDQCPED